MKYPIVTVAGGSCSGKSTFVKGFRDAVVISIDSFYKDISELVPDSDGRYDWDTPDAFDLAACRESAIQLASGSDVVIPRYDYVTAKRVGEETIAAPKKAGTIVIVEGIFALCPPLADLGILRVYLEAPPEIRVARRIKRDTERNRTPQETLRWFINVERGHQKYIEPSKKHANLVIPFSYSPIVFA